MITIKQQTTTTFTAPSIKDVIALLPFMDFLKYLQFVVNQGEGHDFTEVRLENGERKIFTKEMIENALKVLKMSGFTPTPDFSELSES